MYKDRDRTQTIFPQESYSIYIGDKKGTFFIKLVAISCPVDFISMAKFEKYLMIANS